MALSFTTNKFLVLHLIDWISSHFLTIIFLMALIFSDPAHVTPQLPQHILHYELNLRPLQRSRLLASQRPGAVDDKVRPARCRRHQLHYRHTRTLPGLQLHNGHQRLLHVGATVRARPRRVCLALHPRHTLSTPFLHTFYILSTPTQHTYYISQYTAN